MSSTNARKSFTRGIFLTAFAVLAASSSAFAAGPEPVKMVTAATSTIPQDRVYATWAQTHPANNQHGSDYPTAAQTLGLPMPRR